MSSHTEKRVLAGIILLAAGIVLMLKYFDILPIVFPHYLISWKSLLVLLGLVFLITERNKTAGIVLLLVGSIFLSSDIFNISIGEVFRFTIPLVLIIAGVFLVFRRQTYSSKDLNIPDDADSNDFLNDVSIFGGGQKRIQTSNFKGGRLTAIFGGSEIDLRSCKLAPGVNAVDMLCLFGGVEIRVPDNWEVKNEVTAVFGGFSDKRLISKKPEQTDETKVLYLKGIVIFGGGEIK